MDIEEAASIAARRLQVPARSEGHPAYLRGHGQTFYVTTRQKGVSPRAMLQGTDYIIFVDEETGELSWISRRRFTRKSGPDNSVPPGFLRSLEMLWSELGGRPQVQGRLFDE